MRTGRPNQNGKVAFDKTKNNDLKGAKIPLRAEGNSLELVLMPQF